METEGEIGRTDASKWSGFLAAAEQTWATRVYLQGRYDLTRHSPFDKVALIHSPSGQWSGFWHWVIADPIARLFG
jgi:hypothetical protein